MTELRCLGPSKVTPERSCFHLLAVLSDDFEGAFSTRCKCGQQMTGPTEPKLMCGCGKWLACGVVTAGYVQMMCFRDRALVRITVAGPMLVEESRKPKAVPRVKTPPSTRIRPRRATDEDVLVMIEERWQMLRYDRARRSTETAVGLRFDVFNRDGFRCRYCGRGPDQGVLLEADHVIPRSAGGPDSLANLVAACWDCNRGKSKKLLAAS